MKLFELVEKNRSGRDVRKLCSLLGVSRSGYYAWRSRPDSERKQYDDQLKTAISELHRGYKRAYGARRVHHELRHMGLPISVRRTARLMREIGISASTKGLYCWNPGRHEFYAATGNQLALDNEATSAGQQWAGDFTYIKTPSGWLYHAVVMDLFTREVVGWSFSRNRNSELTKSALKMALGRRQIHHGCLFHSDQGIEYTAHEFRGLVERFGMTRSMSRKGSPQDNAAVESFFHSMKTELVHQMTFASEIDAVANIIDYIEFYNRERLHSSLGYQSPMNYGKLVA